MIDRVQIDVRQEIDRYVEQQLSGNEIEELWSQIIQDDEYYDYLNVVANLKAVKEAEASSTSTPVHYLNRYKFIYATAAVILLLITVTFVIKVTNYSANFSVRPVASFELPFQRSANITGTLTANDKVIRQAILLYNDNDLEGAVSILKNNLALTDNVITQSRLYIMLGTLYYNSDNFEEAKSAFQSAISKKEHLKPLMLEKAYWYLGNALYQMDNVTEAEKAMHNVLQLDGAYSRLAKKNLNIKE